MKPMTWKQVLTGERLKLIRGAPGQGPYVAGFELWERKGELWGAVNAGGNGWNSISVANNGEVMLAGTSGKMALQTTAGWTHERFGKWAGVSVAHWGEESWIPVTTGEIYRKKDGVWDLWKPPELADRNTGTLWGPNPNDVWMHTHSQRSGVPPDLGHWDGEKWTIHSLSRSGYVASIHGNASDNVWAVGWTVKWIGKGPLAAHWDGKAWREVKVPAAGRLTAVYVDPEGGVWITGAKGVLLYGDGKNFTPVGAPNENLNGVYAEPGGPVWILVDGARVLESTQPLPPLSTPQR